MYRVGWPWWIHVTLAYATLTLWTAILTAGLSTSGRWPSLGWTGNVERFLIFLVGAAVTRATITNHETRAQIMCWSILAVVFEVGRRRMVGRSNGALGWICSVAGAATGAVCTRHFAHGLSWHNDW